MFPLIALASRLHDGISPLQTTPRKPHSSHGVLNHPSKGNASESSMKNGIEMLTDMRRLPLPTYVHSLTSSPPARIFTLSEASKRLSCHMKLSQNIVLDLQKIWKADLGIYRPSAALPMPRACKMLSDSTRSSHAALRQSPSQEALSSGTNTDTWAKRLLQCVRYGQDPKSHWWRKRMGTGRLMDMAAIVHAVGALIFLGYAQNYYFHLRKFEWKTVMVSRGTNATQVTTRTTPTREATTRSRCDR